LTKHTATFPAKRFNTGCPYSPVPSMATGVIPAFTSQSPDANRSTGMVPHFLRPMTSSGCRTVRIRGDAAGHHALSRHNQPRTMAEDHVRAAPPWEKGLARYPCIASLPGVLNDPWPIGDRAWCRGYPGPPMSLAHGTRRETTSAPAPHAGMIAACLDSHGYDTFFMRLGALVGHDTYAGISGRHGWLLPPSPTRHSALIPRNMPLICHCYINIMLIYSSLYVYVRGAGS
jgi:hypothetical protein